MLNTPKAIENLLLIIVLLLAISIAVIQYKEWKESNIIHSWQQNILTNETPPQPP